MTSVVASGDENPLNPGCLRNCRVEGSPSPEYEPSQRLQHSRLRLCRIPMDKHVIFRETFGQEIEPCKKMHPDLRASHIQGPESLSNPQAYCAIMIRISCSLVILFECLISSIICSVSPHCPNCHHHGSCRRRHFKLLTTSGWLHQFGVAQQILLDTMLKVSFILRPKPQKVRTL